MENNVQNTVPEQGKGTSDKKKKTFVWIGVFAAGFLLLSVAILIVAGVGGGMLSYFMKEVNSQKESIAELTEIIEMYEDAEEEIDVAVINADIQGIGELATVDYMYTDAAKYSQPMEFMGTEIPLDITTKNFVAKWDGTIKAGVDIERVEAEVDKEKKQIIVHIPQAEILSHEIEEESYEVLIEQDGLFNELRIEDIRGFDAETKKLMEEHAIENGILEKALANAKEIIRKLIETGQVEEQDYEVVFIIIEEPAEK